jgi:Flp pilus assembly protein CpaB
MKVAIFFLMILGILAAGSTAVLFGWVQAKSVRVAAPQTDADVLVAQTDLPARTRLTAEHVKVERIPKAGLPADCFVNPAQAVGKTLKLAVIKGQPLAESSCIPPGSIDDLLRPGMLAFPISLSRRFTSVELLYPGCIVDVFVTFALNDRAKGEAVVTPLLQSIQVLGLAAETVVSQANETDTTRSERKKTPAGGNATVTVEVNARQAAALQLAMERGTLGLAMRNPLDKNLNPTDPMVIKEGQLTASSEAMDTQTLALVNQLQQMLGNRPLPDPNCPPTLPDLNAAALVDLGNMVQKRSAWQMTVIRGQKVEEAEVKLKDSPGEETPPADANQAPAGTE